MPARSVSSSSSPTVAIANQIGEEVLRFLAREELAPTPSNYAFGYLVMANGNGVAARAVDAVTMSGAELS